MISWSRRIDGQICLQVKHEESSGSGNSHAAPTSPTNGTTQDPLKTTNISSVPRLNSSEIVPAEKEAIVTPNRSDDDKGGWSMTGWIKIDKISSNERLNFDREWKRYRQQKWARNASDDSTPAASETKINRRCPRWHGGKQTQQCSSFSDLTHKSSHTRTLIRMVTKTRLWTTVTTKSWWVQKTKCLRIVFICDCNEETVSPGSGTQSAPKSMK